MKLINFSLLVTAWLCAFAFANTLLSLINDGTQPLIRIGACILYLVMVAATLWARKL